MLNLNYSPEKVVDTDGMPDDVWLQYRRLGIGGSDVSAIFNLSPWVTARGLYFDKIGIKREIEPSNKYTLDFGHTVEPFVAKHFEDTFETKWKSWLEKKLAVKIAKFEIYKDTWMYKHPLYPFMLADLDYRFRVTTASGEVIEGVFECKTTNYYEGPKKWAKDQVPEYYKYQVRHYMSVMNLPVTIIACLWGNNENDFAARIVKRDLAMEEKLIKAEKSFWQKNVKARKIPLLSKNGTLEIAAMNKYGISKKFRILPELRVKSEDAVSAAEEYLQLENERLEAQKRLNEIISRRDAVKVTLICAIGDKPSAIIQSKTAAFMLTNNRSVRKTLDTATLKNEVPDIYDRYLRDSISLKLDVSPTFLKN